MNQYSPASQPGLPDFQLLFESSPDLYLAVLPNSTFTIVAASNAYLQATMTQRAAIVGRPLFEVFPDNPEDPDVAATRTLRASLERVIATRKVDFIATIHYDIPKSGNQSSGFSERYWRPSNFPVIAPDGTLIAILHRAEDITESVLSRRRSEQQAKRRESAMLKLFTEREVMAAHLAHSTKHDAVTGLPNRDYFIEFLEHALATAVRESGSLTVMVLDLDHFLYINNDLGNEVGNELLKHVGERLRESIRDSDFLARPGGDEFLLLSNTTKTPHEAAKLAEKLAAIFGEPFLLSDVNVFVSTSIGIALYPADDRSAASLVQKADAAMHQAKKNGRGRYEFYAEQLRTRMRQRMEIANSLQAALNHHELEVHYQPRVDLRTREVLGAEALVRWYRSGIGYVAPDIFIPIAEESSLIHDLGSEVLDRVCQDINDWAEAGVPLPLVSVNISPAQFKGSRLVRELRNAIKIRPELAHRLELELTENVLLDDTQDVRWTFDALSGLGLHIAMDDFGTGCSGINYFRRFPIYLLKIDKSFIKNILTDRGNQMLTQSIIDLARNFNLRVVAEGIETEEQFAFLKQRGCHEGQGYLFAPALPATEFLAYWGNTSTRSV